MMAGLAHGVSQFSGLLEGEDVRRTGEVMAALGAGVEQIGAGQWRVTGVGAKGLSEPSNALDFGNSGTGARLVMGVLAGFGFSSELRGDESLSARPMNRVLTPLRQMGITDTAGPNGTFPFSMTGSKQLKAIDYAPPIASAQVKSCIMLAGLNAQGTTIVREEKATRDHTERMLRGFGVDVKTERSEKGRIVSLAGGQALTAIETQIPGDPSSAAFLVAAALISGGDVGVDSVMSNDTRSGFYDVAAMMGADLGADERDEACGERIIDIQSTGGNALKGVEVPERLVPSMIDEFPILGVMAAFAEGETVITGAEELRVKESDRISAVVDMLRVNGVEAEERRDGFAVQGCAGPPPGGGMVETRHDHRIAMSALVMGVAAQNPVSVDDASMIDTSYPDFLEHMTHLGAEIVPR